MASSIEGTTACVTTLVLPSSNQENQPRLLDAVRTLQDTETHSKQRIDGGEELKGLAERQD